MGAVVQELTEIGERLMRALALSLGLAAGAFDHCFDPWPNIQYKVARWVLHTDWLCTAPLSGAERGSHSLPRAVRPRLLQPPVHRLCIPALCRAQQHAARDDAVRPGARSTGILVPQGRMLPAVSAPTQTRACSLSLSRCDMHARACVCCV